MSEIILTVEEEEEVELTAEERAIIEAISPTATVSKSGDTATITITDKNGTTTATISDGTDGTDGQDGQDGYSPTATVSKSGDTATISITDKDGTTTASIKDGVDGTDGQDGQDGYSPTANVTKSGATATITITDKNGTTTATVTDGTGAMSGVVMNGSTVPLDSQGVADLGTVVTSKTDKADKVTGATNGNFAGLDANGNLTDSGHKHSEYLTSHQDISGKLNAAGSYPLETFGGAASQSYSIGECFYDYSLGLLKATADIDQGDTISINNASPLGKKGAVNGKKDMQTAVTDPIASGTTDEFIAGITQDANGVITPVKKTVQDATTNQHGLMSAADKTRVDAAAPAGAVAYTVNGNKSEVSIAQGKYVALINSSISGLSDGLYKAAAAIPANTAIDSTYLTAVSGGLGAEVSSLADHIETINTKNSSSWFNSSYVSSGGATLIQIGDLCIVQLYDIKFSQDISNSQASNAITLVTLPYAENSGGQVFLLNRANDNAQTIRLQVAGSIIRPWWSSIPKTSSGEGWFGIVMFKKS